MSKLSPLGIYIFSVLVKRHVVESHMGLVMEIAKGFRNRGMSLEDMIQEGTIGIMKGLEKFDPDRGFKVSTYVSWWIRAYIGRAIVRNRNIRVPYYMIAHRAKALNTVESIRAETGNGDLDCVLIDMDLNGATRAAVKHFINISPIIEWSLDYHVRDNDKGESSATLKDIIPDEDSERPDTAAFRACDCERLRDAMGRLTYQEMSVLNGIFWGGKNLADVGRDMDLTRERIRQIKNNAIDHLRSIMQGGQNEPQ